MNNQNLKQLHVSEKIIGENTFYIKKFPAFTCANLSGELASLITPVLSAIIPLLGVTDEEGGIDLNKIEIENALPALNTALSGLSGDKIERLMRKLLIDTGNVSFNGPVTDGATKRLSFDLANEIFCGDIDEMYLLCIEVIRLNFSSFFKKLGVRFGNLSEVVQNLIPSTENTEN